MLLPVMPRWQGQTWPVKRSPSTSTRVPQHVSGREVRSALFAMPLYQFEITFDGLSSNAAHPGIAERSLHELQGFYAACGGTLLPFLFVDQVDNSATGQVLGVGDGVTTIFPFQRPVGSRYVEPVSWVTNVKTVYLAGQPFSTLGTGWSLAQPASLVFANAPAPGIIILADFSYAFVCRFSDDQVELDQEMDGVWSLDSLKFQTFR